MLVTTVASVVFGAAASLNLAPDTLGAARVAMPRCTTAALTVVPNLAGSNVASVTVSGLPASCGTATLQVTVANGTTTGSGSAAVPAAGGSVTVALGTTPALTASTRTDILLVGP